MPAAGRNGSRKSAAQDEGEKGYGVRQFTLLND
jgi:hypothetical protein